MQAAELSLAPGQQQKSAALEAVIYAAGKSGIALLMTTSKGLCILQTRVPVKEHEREWTCLNMQQNIHCFRCQLFQLGIPGLCRHIMQQLRTSTMHACVTSIRDLTHSSYLLAILQLGISLGRPTCCQVWDHLHNDALGSQHPAIIVPRRLEGLALCKCASSGRPASCL